MTAPALSHAVLPPPVPYFAPASGQYDVAPGFRKLGALAQHGAADARLFQIDSEFAQYRRNKLECRHERIGKYVLRDPAFTGEIAAAVARFMAERLAEEYPGLFEYEKYGEGSVLRCALTDEELRFDSKMRWRGAIDRRRIEPRYQDALDALCCQVQEDVVVVHLPAAGDAADVNIALHACAPSHWAPAGKLGKSFAGTHAAVPHFEKVARAGPSLLKAICDGDAVSRFNWSIERTHRLNLHPEPPPRVGLRDWERRVADRAEAQPIYLRIERQVLWGLPAVRCVVFTIRVYCRPVCELSAAERQLLARAVRSMSSETLAHRGITPVAREVLAAAIDRLA